MDPVDVPGAEVAARAVVREVTGSPVGVAGAESLVLSLYDLAPVVDDVQAVVWLMRAAEPVRGAEDYP